MIADDGYRLHQNPAKQQVADARASTGDTGDPDKNPDYVIEGHVFDCYSPTASRNVRNIWSEVRGKVDEGQAQRIVLQLEDWRGDPAALRQQFDDWPIPGLKELVAVLPNGTVVQMIRQH